ncbi:helix-turn-helix domain-containing protein [Natronomonas sp. EA1]|uniref:helix-turn-helix domain-containing protein n=1 Tax=Natronomonas sp. EA1 TaxID=3421655 RepID=UPI003EBFF5E0
MNEPIRLDPDGPALPADSTLDREEYLEMHTAVGDPHRFRIMRVLNQAAEQGARLSAIQLADAVELPSNKLHYHLDKLVRVGLVRREKAPTRDDEGYSSYYTPSAMGRKILSHGIEELMRREWEFSRRYAEPSPAENTE